MNSPLAAENMGLGGSDDRVLAIVKLDAKAQRPEDMVEGVSYILRDELLEKDYKTWEALGWDGEKFQILWKKQMKIEKIGNVILSPFII